MYSCFRAVQPDTSFSLCVPALFTLKLLPWVSAARDLKVSAESLWRTLGKSAERCCKNWAAFSKEKKRKIRSRRETARSDTLSTSKLTRSGGFLSSENTKANLIFIPTELKTNKEANGATGSERRSRPPCGPGAVKVHLLPLSWQT